MRILSALILSVAALSVSAKERETSDKTAQELKDLQAKVQKAKDEIKAEIAKENKKGFKKWTSKR